MPLDDTGKAIGEVTDLLSVQLSDRTKLNVSVGRVEPPNSGGPTNPRLNLFLYEAEFDGSLKNLSVYDGQRPQLWLVLRYLITAFDDQGQSDTIGALRHLGVGLRALQEMSYLPLDGVTALTRAALENNPEQLKITFVEASSDLLSKLMQGSDERYRFSMAVELRPVMIATREPGDHVPLVGIDYTQPPPGDVIGDGGIDIEVFASLGMRLSRVEPPAATAGQTITISGENLTTDNVVARIGPVELPVAPGGAGTLGVMLDPASVNGGTISAGQHPLLLVRTPTPGRPRSSNLLVFELLPTVTSVTPGIVTVNDPDDSNSDRLLQGSFEVEGAFLGGDEDDVFVALYANGRTVQVLTEVQDAAGPPPPPLQTRKIVSIPERQAVPPGTYRVIVRVNNSQARQSPLLTLNAP